MYCEVKKMKEKKIVFEDAGENKVAYGIVEDDGDFLKVTNGEGKSIVINKKHIVFITTNNKARIIEQFSME